MGKPHRVWLSLEAIRDFEDFCTRSCDPGPRISIKAKHSTAVRTRIFLLHRISNCLHHCLAPVTTAIRESPEETSRYSTSSARRISVLYRVELLYRWLINSKHSSTSMEAIAGPGSWVQAPEYNYDIALESEVYPRPHLHTLLLQAANVIYC